MPYERVAEQAENPFASLVPDQKIAIIPSFTLESGETLRNVPIAYSTHGQLAASGDNVMVICHALTGSADVSDWWGPLIGRRRAFDTSRFYIVCLNSLGSPYGSASPVTYRHGDPMLGRYGPDFPLTTIRDDVNAHRLILDDLGVRRIATVVGGSMGGMLVLEYAYFGVDYVRTIVPIATSSRHSAWGISWGEAQRQSIYCDPKYQDGYYGFNDPPISGLGAARMSALLTYRSRDSFESRFGRTIPNPSHRQTINGSQPAVGGASSNWSIHNDGHRSSGRATTTTMTSTTTSAANPSTSAKPEEDAATSLTDPQFHGPSPHSLTSAAAAVDDRKRATTYFSAQSYLRYQGAKFVRRFDSNCYIAITRKLDTHDVSRPRAGSASANTSTSNAASISASASDSSSSTTIAAALALIAQPALVLGIQSDGLFTFAEQQELAAGMPHARLRTIDSPEGHDAFLLQFEQVNAHIMDFFRDVLPDIMDAPALGTAEGGEEEEVADGEEKVGKGEGMGSGQVGGVVKTSTFGEAEVEDITAW